MLHYETISPTTLELLKSIQSILKSGQDKLPEEEDTPATVKASQYSFTRGAGYYRRDK